MNLVGFFFTFYTNIVEVANNMYQLFIQYPTVNK